MNTDAPRGESPVTLPERHRFGYRPEEGRSEALLRAKAAADVLLAHRRTRILTALIIAVLQLGLLHRVVPGDLVDATFGGVIASVLSYVLLVSIVSALAAQRGSASPTLVTVALVSDLLFIFALTLCASTPDHYERTLFGTIVVVHVANFFFGRRQAWRMAQIGLGGYLALIAAAVARGLRVDVAEEVWTLVLCAAGITLIMLQAGDVRRRLRAIVRLFEHAEQGDFSREYDVAADKRPDAITRVGVAYNAVRAQLASMVLTDPLTGCLNRRGFDQALRREISRATRAGSQFALLAIDLDHFKLVNDTYGHLAGDLALRAVGALLVKSGRVGDVVARVGGEEFAILLADTGASGAQLFATRLGDRIRSYEFVIGSDIASVTLTTSIGVAAGAPCAVPDFAELLWSRADDALYAAKRAGRSCVRVWNADVRHSGRHVRIGADTLAHGSMTL